MEPTGVVIWPETTTGIDKIGHKPLVLFVCSYMCAYYCDVNLLHIGFVSAPFQLAVMKPEKRLG
jgi:hypothetical protein